MKVKKFKKEGYVGNINANALSLLSNWIGSMLPKHLQVCLILPTIDKTQPLDVIVFQRGEKSKRPVIAIPHEDCQVSFSEEGYAIQCTKRFNPRALRKIIIKTLEGTN